MRVKEKLKVRSEKLEVVGSRIFYYKNKKLKMKSEKMKVVCPFILNF
jgi:hypothetical protein